MLRYAHEVELLDVVPRVKLLKVPPQEFDFLRFEELSRLLEAVRGDPERMALLLMGSDAGLRQGEMVALEWGDVDLVAGTLTSVQRCVDGLVGLRRLRRSTSCLTRPTARSSGTARSRRAART
jgi:integrase